MNLHIKFFLILIFLSSVLISPEPVFANHAVLSISPSTGTFVVDSTFEASIYLNTHNQSINTVELSLKFPPDKLQLVSSSTGKSVIGLWATLPKFNNATGTVELVGGVPGGLNISTGLITTLTFRVKAVGSAVLKFNSANVLLHDGSGTEILTQTQNSIFDLVLPPPAGPVVVSESHPDQAKWNKSPNATLRWGDEGGLEGFSYMISDNPTDVPDDISEGVQQSIVYRNLSEGRHYFHIKALRDKRWGGTTHFALNIDTQPPAEFKVEVIPNKKTSRLQPVIQFESTDRSSGIDHYELKIIPLSQRSAEQMFFIEVQSPYVSRQLEHGKYDIIVRAYDQAGNYRETTQRMEIVPALFRNVGSRGLEIRSSFVLSWPIILVISTAIILILGYIAYRVIKRHRHVDARLQQQKLPNDLEKQLSELQKYRSRYGQIGVLLIFAAMSLFIGSSAMAQSPRNDSGTIAPPIITSYSKDISNQDILYAGGKIDIENAEIILFIQNSETAEILQEVIQSDSNGEWLYRHDTFLHPGNYFLWGQTRVGDQVSPPSPQIEVRVVRTALQLGATRLTYEAIYLFLIALLVLATIGLITFIFYHLHHTKKKHSLVMKEVVDAKESLRRGFAVLNRDLQAELEIIKRAKLTQKLSQEERLKEEQLLKDLEEIEQYITKEVWDIEKAEEA